MSDPHHPQSPDNKNDENVADEKKQDSNLALPDVVDDDFFVKWILKNDIRVIFWGEYHYTKYTCLEMAKFKKCFPILKAIYMENCEDDTPQTESEEYRNYRTKQAETKKPQEFTIYDEVAAFLISQKAMGKMQAFGCKDHLYTRATLEKAIAETEKGELTIIMIGSAHLYALSDPEFMERDFLGPPLDDGVKPNKVGNKAENDEEKNDEQDNKKPEADADLIVYKDAEEALKGMEKYPDRAINNIRNLLTSYGLIDYYATKYNFGMLVVDSNWRTDFRIDAFKRFQKAALIVNQSIRNLMTRLKDRKNIYITRNTREWDKNYWKVILEQKQLSLFEEFDASMPKALTDEIYGDLFGSPLIYFSKYFLHKYGWRDSFALYFTSLSPVIPEAPNPLKAIDWTKKQNEIGDYFDDTDGSEQDNDADDYSEPGVFDDEPSHDDGDNDDESEDD